MQNTEGKNKINGIFLRNIDPNNYSTKAFFLRKLVPLVNAPCTLFAKSYPVCPFLGVSYPLYRIGYQMLLLSPPTSCWLFLASCLHTPYELVHSLGCSAYLYCTEWGMYLFSRISVQVGFPEFFKLHTQSQISLWCSSRIFALTTVACRLT